ncbi:hypothetical protein COW36_08170 [bacterium (Candidatus Blackallbacteria) CG17_big_fil_post_rev_8_21_14_2_50_48_46]|uniref:Transcription factor zinc-finger domain-containing protein n=1 Tax=bacterium (Candidatus Blackallbacteria) CG17_big_fil_post_rev_8_21_14_2_50_48_46 TaxID=2014261 RepID=A0A2M7G647_9BACT|nr:MAG: hypothetical protein COW64_24710 [bacterium (Candidatus Blackallbacteria) CG18_big_fil_WC_8_21_14_2_50_49_26]PIW17465.1 MAG: hypothetical protein COW36_08170 [bacterium (Candidatus Blackallbacteria) CG17_big_fil_post_rev_8_21_14_2_50_48_46]PIW48319.1 MAG: hypothetical protein COW20_09525 [bacterium (Candidatus Blackallbacteria) CG13_big_fil_rev_8_21_14_2_50_49_14]
MLCPACQETLCEISVPPVKVDVCLMGCKGIWFDRGELEKVLKNTPEADQLMNATGWEVKNPEAGQARSCPHCVDISLKTFKWGSQYPVELDVCPGCGGYWLDAGELLLVAENLKQGEKLPQVKPVLKPGVSLEQGEPSVSDILAWEVAAEAVETAIWFAPEIMDAGVAVAEALPGAGEALLSAPGALIEGAGVAAETVGALAEGMAEGVGAMAEGVGAVAEGMGDLVGAVFEFLGGLFN